MTERVQQFADNIYKRNQEDKYNARVSYVLLIVASIMIILVSDEKITFDEFSELLGYKSIVFGLLIIMVANFTYRFFRSYLFVTNTIQKGILDMDEKLDVCELMRVHNLPFKEYFCYIKKKLMPYQIVMMVVFFVSSVLSESIFIHLLLSLLCVASSFLVGKLYENYCKGKIESRKKHLLLAFLDGVFSFIMMMINYGVVLAGAFFAFSILTELGAPAMEKGEVLERGMGLPVFFLLFMCSFCAWGLLIICRSNVKAKWFQVCKRLVFCAAMIGLFLCVASNRFWYTEVNYTTQKIKVVHFSEKTYDFSEIKDYKWVPSDEETENSELKLVLTLPDNTEVDFIDGCAFSTDQGDYEKAAKEYWK